MSRVRRSVEQVLSLFADMEAAYKADIPWDTKYHLVFAAAAEMRETGFRVDYYDPDTTYEEDTTACYNAWSELAESLRKVFPEEKPHALR